MKAAGEDLSMEAAAGEGSSMESTGYDINDKVFDKLFDKANICEIDDGVMIKMKNQQTIDKDPESEVDDQSLITMLKTLPKRTNNPLSINTMDVTSFVDLSTPRGACRKKKAKGKLK